MSFPADTPSPAPSPATPTKPKRYVCKVCGLKGRVLHGCCIGCWRISQGLPPYKHPKRAGTYHLARTVAAVEALERSLEQAHAAPPRVNPVRVVWGVEYEVVWP